MTTSDPSGHAAPGGQPAGGWSGRADLDPARETMQSALQRVADQAKESIPAVSEASVTLVEGGRATSAAWTGLLAFELDGTQFRLGQGPCLQSAVSGQAVRIDDMAAETRWPRFAPLALQQGARSSLSTPIPFQHQLPASLTCYGTSPHGFSAEAEALARGLVGRVAVVVGTMHAHDTTRRTVHDLHEAMRSRAVIEQATGILMGRAGISSSDALDALVRRSQDSDRELRDIAADLVAEVTGERDGHEGVTDGHGSGPDDDPGGGAGGPRTGPCNGGRRR